ncbi:MAG: aminotransferase class V-fold PLP-dependent enzyme, partial [Acidimicrobiia bacterium]|nr:aminotransferase class V-fold PLP-dependent enzyme [Acidimicrobiia bacterium]
LRVRPLMVGGDQERARRAGLENLPAVAGFGAACAALAADGGARLAAEAQRFRRLTDRIAAFVTDGPVGGLRLHGDPVGRLPHLVCVAIDDVEPQAVVLGLDRAGVAVHSGSSCASEGIEPSPVLAAMGVDAERSLRASVGWSTTDADVDALLGALGPVLEGLRALRR